MFKGVPDEPGQLLAGEDRKYMSFYNVSMQLYVICFISDKSLSDPDLSVSACQ